MSGHLLPRALPRPRALRLRWAAGLAATAVAAAGVVAPAVAEPLPQLLGEVSVTALDPETVVPPGPGVQPGTPTRVIAGSIQNFLAFTFTGGPLPAAELTLDVPADWSTGEWVDPAFSSDEERYETPGYVRVRPGTCGDTASVTTAELEEGSRLLLSGLDCATGEQLSVELFYVSAPAQPGHFAFPTTINGLGAPLVGSPSLEVHRVPDVALVVSGAPDTVISGEPFQVVVTAVRDSNGKAHRGFRGTVRFGGECTAGGELEHAFTPQDQGRHVFELALRQVGDDQALVFTDGSNTARPALSAVDVLQGEQPPPPDGCGVRFH